MAYVTYEELVRRYPVMKTAGLNEQDLSSDYIYHSEAAVDGYLAPYYSVPFTNSPAPAIVQDLVKDIAYYKYILTGDPKKADKFWKSIERRLGTITSSGTPIITSSGPIYPSNASNAIFIDGADQISPVFGMNDYDGPYSQVSSYELQSEADNIT